MDSVRKLLLQTIKDRRLTLSEVSQAIGKNHAYMQQFIHREIPANLPEKVRLALAEQLGLDEVALGGPIRTGAAGTVAARATAEAVSQNVQVQERDIKAGAAYAGGVDGSGDFNVADISSHKAVATWGLPSAYIRDGLGIQPGTADIVTIEGNSMDDGSRNSLVSGDKAILDLRGQNYRQGGIFALWDGDTVIVKQVEYVRGTDPPQLICKSLNSAYSPFTVVLDGNAHIIGRVAGKIMRM